MGMRIADSLRQAIAAGELAPGHRIRQEDLASQFAASRAPVRLALRILEAERLITVVPNAGAWVSRFDLAECEEMYQMRERIEPLLLRYSAAGLDSAVLDRMESLAEAIAHDDDVDELLSHDREFHMLSYSGARTAVLGDTIERVWNTTHPYRRAFTLLMDEPGRAVMCDEHRMILQALRSQDVAHAEVVLEGHIRRTRLDLAAHPEVFEGLA